MTKTVLFYARYSTDRQNEVSIETQIEIGREFVRKQGWKLIEVYSDSAVSGTSFKQRPGIQALLKHIKREKIDVVLCVTVDRLSRDMEHSVKILKDLRYHDVELWHCYGGSVVTDMELAMRAVLSHEMIENIRYRTREGMKTATRKGQAAGGLAYGYRIKAVYDVRGDRVPGYREIVPEEAAIIVWIFEQFALGRSPKEIAVELNSREPRVPGPRGLRWRDTAIRGHRDRGTGILNNETYIGRLVFNRRQFRKNPETENREARMNDKSEWVYGEAPELRIVSDDLWAKVKRRQIEVEASFSHTTTNRLNKTHRAQYLLSGLLECAHCGGPYSIMAKDRYGCTNRQKKLPIDQLGGIVCTNSKTISRHELEERVLDAIPANLLSVENTASLQQKIDAQLKAGRQDAENRRERLEADLGKVAAKQKLLTEKMLEQMLEGVRVTSFDEMLRDLEVQRNALSSELASMNERSRGGEGTSRIIVNPSMYRLAMNALTLLVRAGKSERDEVQSHFQFLRSLVQKVTVAPSVDGKKADLTITGRLASILASMAAWQEYSATLRRQHHTEFVRRRRADELQTIEEKVEYLNRFHAVLKEKEAEWKRLQVSVVAGAGFEPAAFRL